MKQLKGLGQLWALWPLVVSLLGLATWGQGAALAGEPRANATQPNYANLSDFSAWLRSRPTPAPAGRASSGYAVEVTPPPSNQLFQFQPPLGADQHQGLTRQSAPVQVLPLAGGASRATRTAAPVAAVSYDDSTQDEELNLLVSNTCERDHMLAEVRTSRPFYGVIHTLNYRRKLICTAEGDGGTQFRLQISLALNPSDAQHCGVTRVARPQQAARAEERQQPAADLLSVVLAVRSHRNIELSEDKLFALNCTNRCRRPDCASGQPGPAATGRLIDQLTRHSNAWRQWEPRDRSLANGESDNDPEAAQAGSRSPQQVARGQQQAAPGGQEPCAPLSPRPAWLLVLALCLAIVLLGMLVSNCIICMALRRAGGTPDGGRSSSKLAPAGGQLVSDLEDERERERASRALRRAEQLERRKSRRRRSKLLVYDNNDEAVAAVQPAVERRQPQQQQQEQLKRSHQSALASLQAAGATSRLQR